MLQQKEVFTDYSILLSLENLRLDWGENCEVTKRHLFICKHHLARAWVSPKVISVQSSLLQNPQEEKVQSFIWSTSSLGQGCSSVLLSCILLLNEIHYSRVIMSIQAWVGTLFYKVLEREGERMIIFNFSNKRYVFIFYYFIYCLSLIIFGDLLDLLSYEHWLLLLKRKKICLLVQNYNFKILKPLNQNFFTFIKWINIL